MQPLNFKEFSKAMSRVYIVEPLDVRAIFDAVRSTGEPGAQPRAAIADVAAGLGVVSPCLLLEELSDRCNRRWEGSHADIWEALGPSWGEGSLTPEEFHVKAVQRLGLPAHEVAKAFRLMDIDDSEGLTRAELLGALDLSQPHLAMEDFRRKVRQCYRSIDATFRESFHISDNQAVEKFGHLNDDMPVTCAEIVEMLEPLEIHRKDTQRLFDLIDANGAGQLTLFEFFRGVRLFAPSCALESIWLQVTQKYRSIPEAFRSCGVEWRAPLDQEAFTKVLKNIKLKCIDVRFLFDLLDVRTCGTITISEVVAALQCCQPGNRERVAALERERKIEGNVKAQFAPLRQTMNDLKSRVRQGGHEGSNTHTNFNASGDCSMSKKRSHRKQLPSPPKDDPRSGMKLPKVDPRQATVAGVPQEQGAPGTAEGPRMAYARATFQRIDTRFKDLPADRKFQVKRTREAIRGYFVSNQEVMQDHAKLMEGHYSRHDLHVRVQQLQSDLRDGVQQTPTPSKEDAVKIMS